jgi:glycine/D-amino acid oxidase-like deaminating enzyme
MGPDERWRRAAPLSFWLDDDRRPEPHSAFSPSSDIDLLVVGGGATGLWAALRALEREPGRSVLLLEASRIAEHASGRNGGFCASSITHGDANGRARWPEEMPLLRRLGDENLDEIEAAIERYGIDCGAQRTGQLDVAIAEWQVEALREEAAARSAAGLEHRFIDGVELRAEFGSPQALAGLLEPEGQIMLNPARLCWGLAEAIESLGGAVCEYASVRSLTRRGELVEAETNRGLLRARKVVVATSAFRALAPRARSRVVPVYDYVLVTEPIGEDRIAEIGWSSHRGVADAGNQFHYLRLTEDHRILFGGYEAAYRFHQRVSPKHEEDPRTFGLLAEHFADTFPSLGDVAFTHRWGGAIDTSTRFCASAALSHEGAVVTINGFTGLGLGASRFFADAGLDRLEGIESESSRTELVRTTPRPFPPEPIRFLAIELTRRAIARADAHQGRRGPWLRLLDRLGLGFDS